jgi:hypothetical protein
VALVAGNLAEVVRALALLPPVVRTEASRTVSAEQARAKLFEMIMNAKRADQVEAERDESAELTALRAQVASLQDECKHLRGTKPRQLPPPSNKPMPKAAPEAKPTPPSAPAPAASPPQNWDSTPHGQAWHRWRNSGGSDGGNAYAPAPGSDGAPVLGWLSRLNAREY